MLGMALQKRLKNQKGFTLVELMVIIVVLGILAAIAIANYQESIAIANGKAILTNLRIINDAIERYHFDTNKYPVNTGEQGLKELVNTGYLADVPKGIKKGEPVKFSSKGKTLKASDDYNYNLIDIAENREDEVYLHAKEATLGGWTFQEWMEYQENMEK